MGNSFSESQICRCSPSGPSSSPNHSKGQGDVGVGKLIARKNSSNFIHEGIDQAFTLQLQSSTGQQGQGMKLLSTTSSRLPGNVSSANSYREETSNIKGHTVQGKDLSRSRSVQSPSGKTVSKGKAKVETNSPSSDQFLKTPPGASMGGGKRSDRKYLGQSESLSSEMKALTLLDNEILDDKSKKTTQTKEGTQETNLPVNVLYYGWFFSADTSTVIREVVMNMFQLCYKEVSQFERFMLTCCADADVRDPLQYYKRPNKRAKPTDDITYHLTAKFLGRLPDEPYQQLVQPFVQKIFRIHLIGIVFTSKTLGVRVQLTTAQQLIFDEKDEHRTGKSVPLGETNEDIQTQLIEERKNYKQKNIKRNKKCKLKSHDKLKSTIVYKPLPPLTTSASRAHLTIGCAPHVAAKQTGDDLVDIVDLEKRSLTCGANFHQDFNVKYGVLRQFGRHANAFVFYPNLEMIIPGEFNLFI